MNDSDTATETIEAAEIERWALAHLERFASSAANLRRVLLRRVRRRQGDMAAAAPLIEALVARYVEARIVDDIAYAAARARARLRRGQSLRTVRAGLAAKGVGAGDVAAALAGLDAAGTLDLAAACAFARRRRLGPFRRGAGDRARELAAFARAGFSRSDAERVLDCADGDAVAALLQGE